MNETRVEWIAADPASGRVLEIARKVADTTTTVLITGESGTGKDQLARWIHEAGPRRDAPFLKIDCASLPAELVESELFGHERGAFTGAEARKPGRLEMAQEGTIVLDEVAALASGVQAKLLRVLEERKFERLGGNQTLEMDSRLIALTNTNLELAVAGGRFREDLYFRLNVLVISVPPLRERPRDVAPLAEYWLARLAAIHGRAGAQIDSAAMRALEGYAWPGNVRELKNAIEHALIFGDKAGKDGTLRKEDFPSVVQFAEPGTVSGAKARSLEDMEKEAVVAALEASHYKIAKAAETLGISRKTLLEKRKKFGLV
ncbi:MAG TPA: sigma 54-interacting transcriptional regulator [Candidatus Acidoferrales bacterium]|nr:sigma 54-interacting transcriptional regulator [Candidatus Acidoferrales bacterium]